MPNPIESQIKERIQSFVSELDLLVRKSTLEALRGVLEGAGAPVRRGRPAGRRGPGRPPAAGGDTDGLASQIRAHVGSNPGQTVGEIVSAVGGKAAAVKKTIKAMLGDGEIRKAGQKRGTRYFPPGPGRLPGAGVKRAKRSKRPVVRKPGRKTRRRASPRKKARKAPARRTAKARAPAAAKGVVVPARKVRRPPKEGATVPETREAQAAALATAD